MENQQLTSQKCVPCEGDVKPFTPAQVAIYAPQTPEWTVLDDKKLEREFKFKNFVEALAFINKVGAIAEDEGHHPDINLHSWNKVTITLWTHAIKGLFLNDFILAAKIDDLLK
jgi:4a-hydroxytetrahydrobiopterin dehydratase